MLRAFSLATFLVPQANAMIARFKIAFLACSLLTASIQAQLPVQPPGGALGNPLSQGRAEVFVLTPDGKLQIGCTKSGVIISDAATGKERHRLPVIMPYGTCAMAVSPDGAAVAVSEYSPQDDEAKVGLWELRGGEKIRTLSLPKGEGPLAHIVHLWFSLDGKSLAVSRTNKGKAVVFDLESGQIRASLGGGGSTVGNLAFSPDNNTLAVALVFNQANVQKAKHSVQIWDVATAKLVRELARFGDSKTIVRAVTFAPDGAMLIAELGDRTILIWDVGMAHQQSVRIPVLPIKDLESLWLELGVDNASKAHQALWALVGSPKAAVPFLQGRLKPVDAAKINQWIADMSNEKYAVRQAAAKELAKAWEQTQDAMRQALKRDLPLETNRRLKQILMSLPDFPGADTARTIRAITTLEIIGSAEARAVLDALARGAPGARNTEEAKASLKRLAHRQAQAP